MVADVQSWIDNPGGNNGWRIEQQHEGGATGQSQKFYARESSTSPPSLAVDLACKTGFHGGGQRLHLLHRHSAGRPARPT
jgi:hypothetical protein